MTREDELVRYLSSMSRPPLVIIAEIGSSPAPYWSFGIWCQAAARAGATHIKAQVFRASHFPLSEQASKLPLEFPRHRLNEFVEIAHEYGLKAGASVFDSDAVLIAAGICDFLKLAEREQNNRELIGQAYNASEKGRKPLYRSLSNTSAVYPVGRDTVVLLGCIPRYPTPLIEALAGVVRWRRAFRTGAPWGWSSHARSVWDCWLAVRLGASVVEKHLALSRLDAEARWSLSIPEFASMTRSLK